MIEFDDVSITLGDFSLKNIHLQIKEGEFFTILGPTGTGKTVILELIAGLYRSDTGKILIDGQDAVNIPPEKRGIGFVYQDYALFPHLTVFNNIAFGLRLRKIPALQIKKSVSTLTNMLEITHLLDRFPGTLSGGEQQRVSLARALILKPKTLLMDEPFGALDPNTKKMLWQELKRIHHKYRCTIIFVTHDFNEAQILADRIGVILQGKLQQVGTPAEVFGKPRDPKVENFLGTASLEAELNAGESARIRAKLWQVG